MLKLLKLYLCSLLFFCSTYAFAFDTKNCQLGMQSYNLSLDSSIPNQGFDSNFDTKYSLKSNSRESMFEKDLSKAKNIMNVEFVGKTEFSLKTLQEEMKKIKVVDSQKDKKSISCAQSIVLNTLTPSKYRYPNYQTETLTLQTIEPDIESVSNKKSKSGKKTRTLKNTAYKCVYLGPIKFPESSFEKSLVRKKIACSF